jgi:uncharacterized protein
MKHKKIVVTGGTGYIGQSLARYFGKDNHVVLLSRQSANDHNNNYDKKLVKAKDGYNVTYWRWDGRHVEKHWAQEIDGADIVINLAGKSVNCRYNRKRMEEIIKSRTDATETIGNAIRQAVVPPKLWINASSATIYHNATDGPQDEFTGYISERKEHNMPYSAIDRLRRWVKKQLVAWRYGKQSKQYALLDKDFSVQVCRAWEKALEDERTPFTRKIALRMAVVLGSGGLIVPFFNLLKFGLGGRQGSGKQMFSWVHIEDVCRAVEWCYEHTDLEGVYNCAAPTPVSNDTLMSTMRKITGHKIGLPACKWMLEFGAALIGTETELILKSRWVLPAKFLQAGFRFKYEKVDDAIKEIVAQTPRKAYHLF